MKKILAILASVLMISVTNIKAQCTQKIQIESILVDACNMNVLEPNNEMLRFKNGPNPLNISQISISGAPASGVFAANKWPTNSLTWNGLIQNAITDSITDSLQRTVVSPCGKLLQPPGGVIPANAEVIMICSTAPSVTDNSFANLVDTIYLVYHNATYTVTTGHFANYNAISSTRGLILFDNQYGCSDTVSYNVSLLSGAGNGDAVNYTNSGAATYYNQGCQAAFVPIATSITIPASVCSNSSATLSGVISGPAVTYTWATSGTGTFSIATGTLNSNNTTTVTTSYTPGLNEAGIVTYTLTAQGKCLSAISTSTGSIYVNTIPNLSVTSSNGATICEGSSTTLSVSTTSTLSTTYTWTPSSPTVTTASYTASPTNTLAPTVYTVTATNACGTNNATYSVTVNPLPTIAIVNDSVCVTGTGTVSASGVTSYTWSLGSVNTSTLAAGVGIYTVSGTGTNGCVNTATAQVVSVSLPVITTDIDAICEGVTNTITASGGTSYTWAPGNTTGSSLTVTPSNNTPIVVTGSGTHGCLNTHTVTINATPTITVNSPSTCSGQAVALQATPSSLSSYTWTGVSSSISSATVAPTSNSSYTVQGTDANGCISNEAVSNVSIATTSQISIVSTDTTPCIGSTYTLSANGATNYTWTASTGTFTSLDGNNTQISVNQGTGSITFTVSGTGSCPATPTVVTINPAAVTTLTISSLPSASVCPGSTVSLTALGANTYTWNPAITNGLAFTPTASATYSVDATDANGCAASSTVAVTVYNLPSITITPSSGSVCSGNTVTLTASGAATYTWNNNSTSNPLTDNITTNNSYTVSGTDINGCVNTATISISITPTVAPLPISGNTVVCAGSSIALNAPSAGIWIGPGPSTNTISTSYSVSITQGGVYTLVASGTCGNAISTYTVIADSVTANFVANPTTGQVPLTVTFTNTSVGGVAGSTLTYTWTFGNGSVSTIANSTEDYTVAGSYNAVLIADDGLCNDTKTVTIIVNDLPTVLIIPNIFTPNGDGVNDNFFITATNVTNFECTIYDRWGLLLYSWQGLSGFWDGKSKSGNLYTDGTYYYLITYTDGQGQQKKEGFFTLIR